MCALDADNKGTGTTPDEIVAAMIYLFSEGASKISGARIPLYQWSDYGLYEKKTSEKTQRSSLLYVSFLLGLADLEPVYFHDDRCNVEG